MPHIRLPKNQLEEAAQLLRALDPDLIVRQSQWDADIDSAFSADALAWTRVILIPYKTMNTTENVPIGQPPINSAVDTRDWTQLENATVWQGTIQKFSARQIS